MLKQIYFLRHFQTENNINHLLNGHNINISIINGNPLHCESNIDLIFCSPALRCKQTIEFFVQDITPPIIYTDLLLERDLGVMEGQSRTQMIKQYPTLFFNNKLVIYATPPQGESFDLFKNRATNFWNYCNSNNKETILICAHNQILKMLYFTLKTQEPTIVSWNSLSFPYGEIIKIQ